LRGPVLRGNAMEPTFRCPFEDLKRSQKSKAVKRALQELSHGTMGRRPNGPLSRLFLSNCIRADFLGTQFCGGFWEAAKKARLSATPKYFIFSTKSPKNWIAKKGAKRRVKARTFWGSDLERKMASVGEIYPRTARGDCEPPDAARNFLTAKLRGCGFARPRVRPTVTTDNNEYRCGCETA
jgi:hypothetical protein